MAKQQTAMGISSSFSFPKGSPSKSPMKGGDLNSLKFPDKIEGLNITPVGISTQEMMKQFKKKHGLPEHNRPKNTRIDMSKCGPTIKRANSMQVGAPKRK